MAKVIMTADDSTSIRQMVSFTLNQAGYDVIEAEDGLDAADKLAGIHVDMLLTDLNMPNKNGLELIEWVRSMPRFKFMPIIMLTTEAETEMKQKGKAAGATGWIVKPFKPEQLLALVKRILR
ncbi:response regulator [Desulfobacter vibrioformis]|uniref:response regulator n=1 Tax=Desulfobacter vibrioformis TaxID=34031 RepID=UPI00055526B3|nr:response regulator [Desulfobacter vibrioformis]